MFTLPSICLVFTLGATMTTASTTAPPPPQPPPPPPPPPPPTTIYVYSLNYTNTLPGVSRFEHVHTVSSLAGIVNRDHPRLFTPLLVRNNAGIDSGSDADDVWRDYLSSSGEWLEKTRWLDNITTISNLVTTFREYVSNGVVLYDPDLPATSNLASTAAGVENLLPVLYRPGVSGSVYEQLVVSGPKLPVTLDLTSNGNLFLPRTKTKAYQWARERWLNPYPKQHVTTTNNSSLLQLLQQPQANPKLLGYYVDLWGAQQADRLHASPGLTEISNHDYFISNRAFFFDLSIWADEKPVDDPLQSLGADKKELVEIFKAAYELTNGSAMIHVGGFTPWWFKYTSDGPGGTSVSKHKGVETEYVKIFKLFYSKKKDDCCSFGESVLTLLFLSLSLFFPKFLSRWATMDLIGAYNAFDDGDACCVGAMANSAFYSHYPLPVKLQQNDKPTVASLHARGHLLNKNGTVIVQSYISFYAGDYDGGAWLYNQFKSKFDDRSITTAELCIPIGWAVDGELSQRFPIIFKYMYENKGPCDFFISGDSGAGYLNPTLLLPNSTTGRRGDSNVTTSGAKPWIEWNTEWYNKFDVTFTGFLINGDAGVLTNASLEMYRSFSPDGVVVTTNHDPHQVKQANQFLNYCCYYKIFIIVNLTL